MPAPVLFEISQLSIVGEASQPQKMPAPWGDVLSVILLFLMVGEELLFIMLIPPPLP